MRRPSTLLPPARLYASQCQRRPYTNSPPKIPISASQAASQMLNALQSKTSSRNQLLDGNQLQKLALTLNHTTIHNQDITSSPPPDGTPIPPGHHLVYFTPLGAESELGPDGSDTKFNAPFPFSRRMWAGGKMTFPKVALRIGDQVEERTRLLSAVPKKSKSGQEMVLVEVEKEFSGPRGIGVVDRRSWIFRPEIDSSNDSAYTTSAGRLSRRPTTIVDHVKQGNQYPIRELTWSPVGLFRFSALTFNSHKVHYDEGWSQGVEGHPGIVVHGPLNLINILDYWRHVHGRGKRLEGITYRALSPLYAGDTYHIKTRDVANSDGGQVYEIAAEKNGTVCMKAEITAA
ncbi:hypothetical protein QQS21_000851 [Conoideocrella luteorostrata]|uniref:Mesaconyl-C4 CoA hydratase n=1 Tax=Conoideocrella luteorostrata TaxID=1105319 RepID=A0AAJ0FY45_9HYPO|nr:hypothetical protein QQS21_000851 [Conoideocrella luteorostrata]